MSIFKYFKLIFFPPPVVIGDVYCLRMDGPWPNKEFRVQVIDAKEGWVRYKFYPSGFRDERLRLGSFNYCYELDLSESAEKAPLWSRPDLSL